MNDPNEQRRPSRTEKLQAGDGEAPRRDRRTTERLTAPGDVSEWQAANQDWRPRNSGRAAGRGTSQKRPLATLPRSPQEVQLWLQSGGWKVVAGAAAFFIVLLIALLAISRNDQRSAGGFADNRAPTAEAVIGVGSEPLLSDATPTPLILPSPTPVVPKFYQVINTGGQGLNLRADHDANTPVLTSYSDGTRLEQIGEDFTGPDRVWRHVRGPDGREGWVAADFLQEVP